MVRASNPFWNDSEATKQRIINNTSRGYNTVNHYYLDREFNGECLDYLQKAYAIMLDQHYDNSEVQYDYFDVAWYNGISIGRYNKPYELKA